MSDPEQTVECPAHGTVDAAYLCTHLLVDPQQEWFCDYPSEENPSPDAWCGACDREFQKEGEWNERNDQSLDIKLICHRCYEDFKGSSVAPLMDNRAEHWQRFVSDAIEELETKQDRLQERFDLSKHERWDLDQQTGEIVFSNAGVPAVAARFQFVGSTSTVSDTWLWSWANFSLERSNVEEMLTVRTFGEAQRFATLIVPKWPAAEEDGWELTAVATKVLDAEGAYRAPTEAGFVFMALTEVRRVQ